MITVAIVDNDPYARQGLATQLERAEGIHVAAFSASVVGLMEILPSAVDLVILDAIIGPGNQLMSNLASLTDAGLKVLVVTCDPDRSEIAPALRRFPASILAKDDLTDSVFFETIRRVAAGQVVVPAPITVRICATTCSGPELTRRQREVLEIMANGIPAKVAARHLGIRYDTLHEHVRQIRERFRLAGHPIDDLITMHYKAIELGYIPDPRQVTQQV